MAAEQCPACKARLGDDDRPTCNCAAPNAEDAVKAAFDAFRPMRVRPYFVPSDDPAPGEHESPRADETRRLPLGLGPTVAPNQPSSTPGTDGVGRFGEDQAPGARRRRSAPASIPFPAPSTFPASAAFADSGSAFGSGSGSDPGSEHGASSAGGNVPVPHNESAHGDDPGRRRSRRKGVMAAALVGTAALGVGVFSLATGPGDDRDRGDRALPDTTDSAPTAPAPEVEEPGAPSSSPRGPQAAQPSMSTRALTDRRARATNPGSTRVDGSVSVPRATANGGTAGGSGSTGSSGGGQGGGAPVLRMGDTGPEVVELQKRLKQACLTCYVLGEEDGIYDKEVANGVGNYQRQFNVKGDPKGVYGPNTRRSLESHSDEP